MTVETPRFKIENICYFPLPLIMVLTMVNQPWSKGDPLKWTEIYQLKKMDLFGDMTIIYM